MLILIRNRTNRSDYAMMILIYIQNDGLHVMN